MRDSLLVRSSGLPVVSYAFDHRAARPGNAGSVLHGGAEVFPAMLSALKEAKREILLETYILRSDETGQRFADVLCERAKAGVVVRLLFDSLGSRGLDGDFLACLERAGVEVHEYHPIAPWRRRFGLSRLGRRDHRKILIVDHQVGFTGGINIGNDYASVGDGGQGWHDVHARVEGPVVSDLMRTFRRAWVRAGGRPFRVPEQSVHAGNAWALIVDNKVLRTRMEIRRAYLHAIGQAQHTIRIMNAYFLPDLGFRLALKRAAKRGVDVRVIVPGHSDLPPVKYASRYLFSSLLSSGIRVFEWPGKMMHAKTAVVDGLWSAVGSYNLDYVSLFYNLEVLLCVMDAECGQQMEQRFAVELASCREIIAVDWKKRSVWEKLAEWFFFRVRRWL